MPTLSNALFLYRLILSTVPHCLEVDYSGVERLYNKHPADSFELFFDRPLMTIILTLFILKNILFDKTPQSRVFFYAHF